MGKKNWKLMDCRTRKFGYDIAYAQTTVGILTTCKPMSNVRLFIAWRERVWPPASCEARQLESQTEKGKVSVSVLSIKLS